jgi:3-hydroxyacyl-CoA dehydrogenase
MIHEVICILEERIASIEDIDKAFVREVQRPIGPLSWTDFIGLDIALNIVKIMSLAEDWSANPVDGFLCLMKEEDKR